MPARRRARARRRDRRPRRQLGDDGPNVLAGGGGRDGLTGAGGDDELFTLDGLADAVDCGPGVDSAVTDWQDTVTGCEDNDATVNPDRDGDGIANLADCAPDDAGRPAQGGPDGNCDGVVDAAPAGLSQPGPPAGPVGPPAVPPGPDTEAPALSLTRTRLGPDGRLTVRLFCDEACRGRVALVSARRVRRSGRARAVILRLAAKRFALASAGVVTVTLALSRAELALLRRLGGLVVTVRANAADAAGNRAAASASFTARLPQPGRARRR